MMRRLTCAPNNIDTIQESLSLVVALFLLDFSVVFGRVNLFGCRVLDEVCITPSFVVPTSQSQCKI